jgi:AraC family transcriptional regulator, L-arginine-responsive activator
MIIENDSRHPLFRIALFAPQGCSILSYGVISEPFLIANQLLGIQKYHLTMIRCAGYPAPIVDKNVFQEANFSDQQNYDLLIIIAETLPEQTISIEMKQLLKRYYRQQAGQILSVQAGLWWLLDSGIGFDHEWVVHWSLIDDIKDHYPNVTLSHDLYKQDGRLHSCAGKLAILDYLLSYLLAKEKNELINRISDHLCLDRLRSCNERQRLPNHFFAGEDIQPRLTMAIDLMEKNIEEPLSTDDIAERVSISRRQLERLFKRYINTMPSRYYMKIRLKRAHHLLQTSNMSILQIGLSCGFSSGPHFSSSYKSFYQSTPREERAKRFASR